MKNPAKPATRPLPSAVDALSVDVVEKNTETSWALFQTLRQQHERGFVRTAAAALESAAQPRKDPTLTLDDVLVEARRNNRVCPLPAVWQKLFDYLPNKTEALPAVPRNEQEWARMSSLQKRTRFREHIEWAATQGVLKQVHAALQRLPEERWYHMGA